MIASVWASMTSWITPTSLFVFLNLVIGTIVLTSRKNKLHHHQQQHDHLQGPNYYTNPPGQLARAPSLLDRVKSINFSLYKFDQPPSEPEFNSQPTSEQGSSVTDYVPDHQQHPIVRTPSLLDRLKSINLSSLYSSEQRNSETEILDAAARPEHETVSDPNRSPPAPADDHFVKRSKSDSAGNASTTRDRQPEKMTKSASEKAALGRFDGGEEEEEEEEEVEWRVPATTRVEKWSDKKRVFGEDEEVDAKADDFINRFKQQLKLQRLESLKRFAEMLKGKQS